MQVTIKVLMIYFALGAQLFATLGALGSDIWAGIYLLITDDQGAHLLRGFHNDRLKRSSRLLAIEADAYFAAGDLVSWAPRLRTKWAT